MPFRGSLAPVAGEGMKEQTAEAAGSEHGRHVTAPTDAPVRLHPYILLLYISTSSSTKQEQKSLTRSFFSGILKGKIIRKVLRNFSDRRTNVSIPNFLINRLLCRLLGKF